MQDTYFKEKKGQKEIHFLNRVIQDLSHQHDLKVTYSNGFHVNYSISAIERVPLDVSIYQ